MKTLLNTLAEDTVKELVTVRRDLHQHPETAFEEVRTAGIVAERLKALSDLALIAGRSGRDGRTGAVVAAVIEIAARASSGPERARVWQVMAGADDPRLVGPLVDTLLYDTAESVRFEAAALLETFASDPTAQAALTQAGSFDTAPAVRERATWSALSAQGRRDYVSAALVDASLSDADRVAPLTYGADAPGSPSGPRPEPGLLADGAAATALVGIIARSNDVRFKAPLLLHLGAIDQPDVVAFLIDKVSSDPAEVIRSIAVEALRGRVADPNVRAVLESARASDASSEVRGAAASVLDAGA